MVSLAFILRYLKIDYIQNLIKACEAPHWCNSQTLLIWLWDQWDNLHWSLKSKQNLQYISESEKSLSQRKTHNDFTN